MSLALGGNNNSAFFQLCGKLCPSLSFGTPIHAEKQEVCGPLLFKVENSRTRASTMKKKTHHDTTKEDFIAKFYTTKTSKMRGGGEENECLINVRKCLLFMMQIKKRCHVFFSHLVPLS